MSRRTTADRDLVFRVVDKPDDGKAVIYGPYSTIGVAKGLRTAIGFRDKFNPSTGRHEKVARPGRTVKVQSAAVVWEDVDD